MNRSFVLLLCLLFLCLGQGRRIVFLADVHFDPFILREVIQNAWTKKAKSLSHEQRTSLSGAIASATREIITVDMSNMSDVMDKVCRVKMVPNPFLIVAVSRKPCNLPLAVFSTALDTTLLEVPIRFEEDSIVTCHFRPRMENNDRPTGEIKPESRFNGQEVGKYLACTPGQKVIIIYDSTVDTEKIGSVVDGLGDKMRRTTIQKIKVNISSNDVVDESTHKLVSSLISRAMNELWDEVLNTDDSGEITTESLAFVVLGEEETIRSFVLYYIPKLPFSLYVHYYLVDTGWSSHYFAQSVLFHSGLTVLTVPKTYETTLTMREEEIVKVLDAEISKAITDLLPALIKLPIKDLAVSENDWNQTICCGPNASQTKEMEIFAKQIRMKFDKKIVASRPISKTFPFFITTYQQIHLNSEKEKLQACTMIENGTECHMLSDTIQSCKTTELPSKSPEMGNVKKDAYLGEYSWQNITFKVATLEDEPFVFVRNDSNGNIKFSGFSIDLLHLLSEMLQFQYELYEVEDRKYGAFKNGKWNGLVGDVVGKKADFAIAAMTITPQRETVVDFTKRYMDYAVGILTKKPRTVTSLFAFLNPFDNSVWYSIIAGLFVVSILLYVLNRLSPKPMNGPPCHDTSLHGTFWFVYSSLVQQGTDMNLVTLSSQIVTGVWWFFILIIISSYTANLAAHLTITRLENHITSFQNLAKQSEISFGTAVDTSIYDFLRTKGLNAKDHSSMWARLWHVSNGSNSVSDPKEGFAKVKYGNYAFLWDVAVIEYLILTDQDCSFSTVPDSIYEKGYGIAVEQGNPIREALSMGILQLQDRGEIARLKQRWWSSAGKCPIDHSKKRSHFSELTLENFAGVFCVLACGLVIATIVAAIELNIHVNKPRKPSEPKATVSLHNVATEASSEILPKVFVERRVGSDIHIVLRNFENGRSFSNHENQNEVVQHSATSHNCVTKTSAYQGASSVLGNRINRCPNSTVEKRFNSCA